MTYSSEQNISFRGLFLVAELNVKLRRKGSAIKAEQQAIKLFQLK